MSPLSWIGWGALAVVAVGWLIVSFRPHSRSRTRIEWVATTALYVFLLRLFVDGVMWARENENTLAVLGFGFLAAFFAAGLVVSAWKTVALGRGDRGAGHGATG